MDNEIDRIYNSYWVKEDVTAFYTQVDARLVNDRLRILASVRYEKTEDDGIYVLEDPDAPFVRNADGSLQLDVDGNRIRKPGAPAEGSIEEARLVYQENGSRQQSGYDGFYPTINVTFNATENLLLRAGFAKSFGRPLIWYLVPYTRVSQNDNPTPAPGDPLGTIDFSNTGLKPYSAKHYDLSLEYYFPKGGQISLGVFRKDITNSFGGLHEIVTPETAAQIGLDPKYVGYFVNSQTNVGGAARIDGIEFNYAQPLTFIPHVGENLDFFVNGTKLKLSGPNETNFGGFIPESGNTGITFSLKPATVQVLWNYRGRQERILREPPRESEFYAPRTSIDVNAEYQFSRRFTFFTAARNITNKDQTIQIYLPGVTPDYARNFFGEKFGVRFTAGIKGTF